MGPMVRAWVATKLSGAGRAVVSMLKVPLESAKDPAVAARPPKARKSPMGIQRPPMVEAVKDGFTWRAWSGLDGDRGADGDVVEEVGGHVFGHADAAVAGWVAREEASVHADAVVGEAHEVGHFGAFEFETGRWAVGAVVDIAVDDIAVLVDEGTVAAGFVAFVFLDDAEGAGGSAVADVAGGEP